MRLTTSLKKFLAILKKSRKHQIIFGLSIFLLLVLVILLIYALPRGCGRRLFLKQDRPLPEEGDTAPFDYKLPSGIRTIDGVPVDEAEANLRPIAIVIENLYTVRPQYGLSEANLTYEVLTEGGIPRFLAIFSGKAIEKIGPVRSARVYFLDWVVELDAMFIHCGGDPYALRLIDQYYIKDFDQFGYGTYYWRSHEAAAPHNLFTKSELLLQGMDNKEWTNVGEFTPWLFKQEKALEQRPEFVDDIVIDFSSAQYEVVWKYDRENNEYRRYNGNVVHVDQNNGEQIRAKNVVVQYMVAKLKDEDLTEGRLGMHTIGGDKALIFRDGEVISGLWKKNYLEDRTRFYTEDWQEIEFNPGATWVEVVPPEKSVLY